MLKTPLRSFSKPNDIGGYSDISITDDMVSDIYLKFSQSTRVEESNEHLRTLTGACADPEQSSVSGDDKTELDLDGFSDHSVHRPDVQSCREGQDSVLVAQA